jgi:hypothetical protein
MFITKVFFIKDIFLSLKYIEFKLMRNYKG